MSGSISYRDGAVPRAVRILMTAVMRVLESEGFAGREGDLAGQAELIVFELCGVMHHRRRGVYVPVKSTVRKVLKRLLRNRAIMEARYAGATIGAPSLEHGITTRTVHRILKDKEAAA